MSNDPFLAHDLMDLIFFGIVSLIFVGWLLDDRHERREWWRP